MSRKKSRKIGLIGVRKQADKKFVRPVSDRPKKKTGRPAGSRHSQAEPDSNSNNSNTKTDPRLGSKQPISLVAEPKPSTTNKPAKRKFFSPKEELNALESDSRLQSLLDKLDDGKTLKKEDQDYVDHSLQRHKVLCKLLGLEEEMADSDAQQDPIDSLDAIKLDDYQ